MSSRRHLVLFVEGEGDKAAVPVLVRRLIAEHGAWEHLIPDPEAPFRVGGIGKVLRDGAKDWVRLLEAAAKTRKPLGAVLLILDGGDVKKIQGKPFCARDVARYLSQRARDAGGGSVFSVATVFALCEYESWLIAGVESLAGKPLPPDGREGVKAETVAPAGDLEGSPRGAKEWLGKRMASGYKETTDQEPLTQLVDLDAIRRRNLRSFRRLETAVTQLVTAVQSGNHIVSPPEITS